MSLLASYRLTSTSHLPSKDAFIVAKFQVNDMYFKDGYEAQGTVYIK